MARFRGEASRLEVEVMAATRRAELAGERLESVLIELDEKNERLSQLLSRESTLAKQEAEARRQALDNQLKYEGGLDREQAEVFGRPNKVFQEQRQPGFFQAMKAKVLSLETELQEASREVERYKQLADIANQQAQSLSGFRQQYTDELKELREYCARLESRR